MSKATAKRATKSTPAKASKVTPKPVKAPKGKYALTAIGQAYKPGGKAGNADNWALLVAAISKGLTVAQAKATNPCPGNPRFLGYCLRKERVEIK